MLTLPEETFSCGVSFETSFFESSENYNNIGLGKQKNVNLLTTIIIGCLPKHQKFNSNRPNNQSEYYTYAREMSLRNMEKRENIIK